MGKKYLHLVGDYALEVLSYYIWGEKNKPNNIINEKYANRNLNKNTDVTLYVSVNEFMSRYFQINTTKDFKQHIANIPMFRLFFENRHRFGDNINLKEFKDKNPRNIKNGKLVLNHKEFVELFYGIIIDGVTDKNTAKIINSALNPQIYFSMYRQDPSKVEDFAQAAFVFGSSKFTFNYEMNNNDLNDKVRYVLDINEDGSITPSHIENLKFTLDTDNFDFDSFDGLAKMVNPVLKNITDPNDIGKTIKIEFINDFYPNNNDIDLTLTAQEFKNLEKLKVEYTEFEIKKLVRDYAKKYISYFRKIINSDIINYSAEGKYLIYGNKNDNVINKTVTKAGVDLRFKLTFDDINSLTTSIVDSIFFIFTPIYNFMTKSVVRKIVTEELRDINLSGNSNINPHSSRLDNGIIYLLGDGNDAATGTNKDDILIGGNDSDTLNGGKGNDILIAGNRTKDNKDDGSDNSSNTLYGGDGDDKIYGSSGDDFLHGDENPSWFGDIAGNITDKLVPKGDDTIHGGKGNDTYIFERGFGNDTIINYNPDLYIDTVEFKGINKDELTFKQIGTDLSNIMTIKCFSMSLKYYLNLSLKAI